jgi:putative acetyltransferase
MTLRIDRADLDGPDAAALIGELNAELSGLYPEPGANHFGLAPRDVAPGRGAFLVAYRDDQAVGCGAMRLIDPTTAELKRMFVKPEARGSGLGRRLVAGLENEASRIGATRVVLETGIRQRVAIALYARCGYAPIPLYGEYNASPGTSVCLGKELRQERVERSSTSTTSL